MEPLLASGRDTDVHAAGPGLIARTYRDGRSARHEAETVAAVHALGYPVPRIERWYDATIVMERVDGPTLGEQLVTGQVSAEETARTWAALHRRLHALPWEGGSLLHLDLHPFNVIAGAQGPVVIDWSNAEVGEPGLDVALSALMLAGAVLAPSEVEDTATVRALLAAYAASIDTPYVDHLEAAATYRLTRMLPTPQEREVMPAAVRLARDAAG